MKNIKLFQYITLLTLFFAMSSIAADLKEGQSLYEKDCTKCHDSSVFTREERKINDADSLKAQVKNCVSATGASWFEEDEDNVTAYLTKSFYKFNPENK